MPLEQTRTTFASFKAHWIHTSPSLHLATFSAVFLSQYDTPPLRDVSEVRQAFAASVCTSYQSMEQTWSSTAFAVNMDIY